MNLLQRICPLCNDIVVYKHKQSLWLANKRNSPCRQCVDKKKIGSHKKEETKRKISVSITGKNNPFYGKHHTQETKDKLSKVCGHDMSDKMKQNFSIRFSGKKNPFYGKTHTEETKKKISNLMMGRKCGNRDINWRKNISNSLKGHIKSAEHKRNIGIASKSRIMDRKINQGILKIGYNRKACEYFNKLNEELKWDLVHAENGGEARCGNYLLDAYDKQQNVVVEYDEKHHYDINGKLKQKDVERMDYIISSLKCSFYRFNETSQLLTKVI